MGVPPLIDVDYKIMPSDTGYEAIKQALQTIDPKVALPDDGKIDYDLLIKVLDGKGNQDQKITEDDYGKIIVEAKKKGVQFATSAAEAIALLKRAMTPREASKKEVEGF